jgi:hypothetical protein
MAVTAGERRVVSVLIADIVGSTAIAERLGPERSKFLFDEVVRLMCDQVRRYEGTVAQLTGDGVYALFGAPVAHEGDSERAVRAAIGIHEALAGYSRQVAEAYEVDLAARVAVNTAIPASPVIDPYGMLDGLLQAKTLYRDAEIMELLDRARSALDQGVRMRRYREVERLWITERAAVIPVAYLRDAVVRRPWVEGLWATPLSKGPLDEVVVRRG